LDLQAGHLANLFHIFKMIDKTARWQLRRALLESLKKTQLFLSLVAIFFLSSCRQQPSENSSKKNTPTEAVADSRTTITDDKAESATSNGDPLLSEVEVLIKYGHYLDALEVITEKILQKPQDENLLKIRTLIFLKAGQPELAALSDIEHARAVNKNYSDGLIEALLHENQTVRMNAIQALEIGEDPRRFEAVMPLAATDESDLVRVTALRLLKKSQDQPLKNTFLALCNDKSWIVRAEAIEALAHWNDPDVRAAAWRATDDEELLVRHRARAVVSSLLAPEFTEEYVRMAGGNNKQMAVAAALALASAGHTEATDILIEALLTSDDISIRREAARALGKVPGEDPAPTLEALHSALSESDSSLLSAILDALEMISDSRSIDPLSRFAKDPLVPAVLSRRAFELLRTLCANLSTQDIQTSITSARDDSTDSEEAENTVNPHSNEVEP
jgi:HEAT repeat protein